MPIISSLMSILYIIYLKKTIGQIKDKNWIQASFTSSVSLVKRDTRRDTITKMCCPSNQNSLEVLDPGLQAGYSLGGVQTPSKQSSSAGGNLIACRVFFLIP